MSTVRRACDACHRRKIKCDGKKPCRNCRQASLICTFNAVPQRKGPKGSRARVLSEIRDAQQGANPPSNVEDGLDRFERLVIVSPWAPTPGLLSPAIISGCVDFFFAHMYPTMPILHRERFQRHILDLETSLESYCFVTSLCAFMLIQPGMELVEGSNVGMAQDGISAGRTLVEEVLRVRKGYDYVDSPSTATVITSFFLFACYFGLDKHKIGWFYLREATTLAQILGMSDESTYHTGDVIETIRQRRLYWLLFVTERAYAMQRHHPLTLSDTIEMPTADEDLREKTEVSGFIYLVNLFRPFDETFVGLWNKTRADCSTTWLAQLQQQLSDALPAHLESTETQAADLLTSQQWLRTMVWQLSITNGYLSSKAADTSMTFKYPVEIARDLVRVTGQLSQQSMEVHGTGLIGKIFDVACTLTDVMACVPMESTTLEVGPQDYLNHFLNMISTLRGGQSRYLPVLLAKVDEVMATMSGPVIPLLSYPDEEEDDDHQTPESYINSSSSSSSLDSSYQIFTPPSLSAASSDMSFLSVGNHNRSSNSINFSDSWSVGTGSNPGGNNFQEESTGIQKFEYHG